MVCGLGGAALFAVVCLCFHRVLVVGGVGVESFVLLLYIYLFTPFLLIYRPAV